MIFILPPKELAPQLRDAQTALLEETSKECKDITLNEIPVADAHIRYVKSFIGKIEIYIRSDRRCLFCFVLFPYVFRFIQTFNKCRGMADDIFCCLNFLV